MTKNELVYLSTADIYPHSDNPRKELGDLSELAESVKVNGILQNLTVVPRAGGGYTVIIGHRRLGAAKMAGLDTVPCVIADMDDKTQISTMLTENMQRHDLTPYEQAQSFAQLLDFGMSVEEIADKSGFSPATVRRRVKMAELDAEKLKAVSDRQINLADFDELAKIEDLARRNELLEKIGTRDFDMAVKGAIRLQEIAKHLPRVRAALKAAGVKKLKNDERYNSRFESVGSECPSVWEWQDSDIPKVSGQLFYYIQEWTGDVEFYTERKRAKPERKSKEEKARELAAAEAWAELERVSALAYELRQAFVDRLSYNPGNAEKMLRGALFAGVYRAARYIPGGGDFAYDLLNIEKQGCEIDGVHIAEELPKLPRKYVPQLIYALFGDGREPWTPVSMSRRDFPRFGQNGRLLLLYKWLQGLGYEMSTEEMALMDGSHEVYKRGVS